MHPLPPADNLLLAMLVADLRQFSTFPSALTSLLVLSTLDKYIDVVEAHQPPLMLVFLIAYVLVGSVCFMAVRRRLPVLASPRRGQHCQLPRR